MELTYPCKSSSTSRDEEIEALELLDEYWFFHNLLHRRTGISRSSSDPYPSSNNAQVITVETKDDEEQPFPSNNHGKDDKNPARRSLLRTPSLPPYIGREDVAQEKASRRSSKFARQASLCSSDVLPPLSASKAQKPSPSSIGKHQAKVEGRINDSKTRSLLTREAIYRSLSYNCKKSSKSLSELEFEEVQGFKDLGFIFNEEDLSPSVVSIIPGLQGKKKPVDQVEKKVRRPYLSEAWIVHRSTPIMAGLVDTRSMKDMKAQLKFWARAVAFNVSTNVREEDG